MYSQTPFLLDPIFAHWLQPLLPEVSVQQIDTAEPFWAPK